jgi:outer membrane protein assembly factor BamB
MRGVCVNPIVRSLLGALAVVAVSGGALADQRCIEARGAGVTAQPAVDASGRFVYMNTVGCYTFPSVGDSDTVFKLDAATGAVVWKNRVDPPEQFGYCLEDTSVDCGSTEMCAAVGGACRLRCLGDRQKECTSGDECEPLAEVGFGVCRGAKAGIYHDVGFLNGPILVEADHGNPACDTNTLVVSGSKNGSLYAFCESTGEIVWRNALQPTPVSPNSAAFGLFNAPIVHADGRIFAATDSVEALRVCDNDHARECSDTSPCADGGTCLAEPHHLLAFDARDGRVLWSDPNFERSWHNVGVHDGVVYAAPWANFTAAGPGEVSLYAYDAETGERLAEFPLPTNSASRPTVAGDSLYVGYGVTTGGVGGFRRYKLAAGAVPADRVTKDNVDKLELYWNFETGQQTVTQPVVANGLVYIASGAIVAAVPVDAGPGELGGDDAAWAYLTRSAGGVQGDLLVAPDGSLVVADGANRIHRLDPLTGQLLWDTRADVEKLPSDHIWSGAALSTTASSTGMLYVGIASDSDNPCTVGRLVAVDFATGEQVWEYQTVPDKVCENDTSVECTTNVDCGAAPTTTSTTSTTTTSTLAPPECTVDADCDDADECTVDRCVGGACQAGVETTDGVLCSLGQLRGAECNGEPLPKKLRKTIGKKVKQAKKWVKKAAKTKKAAKASKYRGRAAKQLDAIAKKARKTKTAALPQACKDALEALVAAQKGVVTEVSF